MIVLSAKDIGKTYGVDTIIENVSFHINQGDRVGIVGANGAGKSTLLKCLSSEKKAAGGTITFDGKPLPPKPYQVVEEGMVIVPEGRQIFYKLSVKENLKIGCCLRKDADGIRTDFERIYAMFPRLKERESQYGGLLSGGEQQMLAIARGLMARPKLLMLDEPSLGLAPIIVNQIMDILKEVNQDGTAILLIEQNARKALKLCDRAYLVNVGNIVAEGTGADLLADEKLMQAYLGQ